MTNYTLKGNPPFSYISFTIHDLIPVKQKRAYSFDELVKHIDYSHYHFNDQCFKKDYEILYAKPEHKNQDFFRIKDTEIIVIPGNHIYPTILTPDEVKELY